MSKQHKTSIGGQAVIEGIMMRGPEITSLAVRVPDGSIDVETWENKKVTAWYKKTPFVRGIFNFVDTMRLGYKCLMKSAEKSGSDEGEPDKVDLWLNRHFGEKATGVLTGFASIIAVILALFLFMVVPTFVVKGFNTLLPLGGFSSLVEGLIKIAILVGYMAAVSRMKDIHRMFQYHGAEHKTIFCYESGEELTVENVRRQKRFHPRCGTSFLLIVVVVSVLVTAFVTWSNPWLRVALKVLLLPLVVGISYEIIKLAGRYTNLCTRIISAPGMWLQHITTQEPADEMIEVAIASLKPVLPQVEGSDRW
ncbi:MAG: DUF1385 domain-containing protein [Oscillospiraceae bacterium]|nr:DUF1385 domain-containing protein [Oscillospiraceae bacterium]